MLQILISKKSSLTQKDENVYNWVPKKESSVTRWDKQACLALWSLQWEHPDYCQKQIFLIKA